MADKSRQAVEAAISGLFRNPPLESVLTETGALFHRLRRDAERIHPQGQASSGRRSVLRGLARMGSQTVPAMARQRPVSRQYMQRIVNELTEEGLVEAVDNPAHKRSVLIQLTEAGRLKLAEMSAIEENLLAGVDIDIPSEDLSRAADVLRTVRKVFEGKQWQSRITAAEENRR